MVILLQKKNFIIIRISIIHRLRAFRLAKVFRKWFANQNSVKILTKIMQKSSKIHQTSGQNPSKIDENVSLGRFGSQVAPRSAPGRPGPLGVLAFLCFFEKPWGDFGPFRVSTKIGNRPKIVHSSLDRPSGPPKMLSGRGFGKNLEI